MGPSVLLCVWPKIAVEKAKDSEDTPTVVTSTQDDVSSSPPQAEQMTAGQKALQKLRDELQVQKDEELCKVKMLHE